MRENEKVKRGQGGREERGREEGRERARTSGDNEIEEVKERERERNTHTHTHTHTPCSSTRQLEGRIVRDAPGMQALWHANKTQKSVL